jgi:hypothetical protein
MQGEVVLDFRAESHPTGDSPPNCTERRVNKMHKGFFLSLVFASVFGAICGCFVETGFAVTANERISTFTQPDGSQFQARLKGDEFYAYWKTGPGS